MGVCARVVEMSSPLHTTALSAGTERLHNIAQFKVVCNAGTRSRRGQYVRVRPRVCNGNDC
jgi:hypothetical protein